MSNELFFIPILTRALSRGDSSVALHEAFREIRRLGEERDHREGYEQFEQFITAVAQARTSPAEEDEFLLSSLVQRLIDELSNETFEGDMEDRAAALELIQSRDEWQKGYERQCVKWAAVKVGSDTFQVILKDETGQERSATFSSRGGLACFDGITSGFYSLSLDTGLVLWEGILEDRHLIWERAFPSQPLDLAADTAMARRRSTIEERLLDGAAELRISSGIENGRVEILFKPFGKPRHKR